MLGALNYNEEARARAPQAPQSRVQAQHTLCDLHLKPLYPSVLFPEFSNLLYTPIATETIDTAERNSIALAHHTAFTSQLHVSATALSLT